MQLYFTRLLVVEAKLLYTEYFLLVAHLLVIYIKLNSVLKAVLKSVYSSHAYLVTLACHVSCLDLEPLLRYYHLDPHYLNPDSTTAWTEKKDRRNTWQLATVYSMPLFYHCCQAYSTNSIINGWHLRPCAGFAAVRTNITVGSAPSTISTCHATQFTSTKRKRIRRFMLASYLWSSFSEATAFEDAILHGKTMLLINIFHSHSGCLPRLRIRFRSSS